ncbi:MAG: hypothetical protein RBG13Loki_4129 [Promethearchaeota archaeon CR_4]|nr:MAG: hypothetical protein RBG13Loki_4129 [Candidatus Lokiarchaeota archaeon CR_4]
MIDADDIYELVGKIILGPDPTVEGNGRTDAHGGDQQDSQDHPLWSSCLRVYPEDPTIIIRDFLEAIPDFHRRQAPGAFALLLFVEGSGFFDDNLATLRLAVRTFFNPPSSFK